jgi:hypothetical protein
MMKGTEKNSSYSKRKVGAAETKTALARAIDTLPQGQHFGL